MALAMSDEEDRSGKAAAGRIPDEFMKVAPRRGFGELEFEILNLLSETGRMTVKEVHLKLGEEDKYTTVMTVLSRLFDKGQVSREKSGSLYEYWIPSQAAPKGLLTRLRDKLFKGKSALMINYLLETADDISPQELKEIEKLIKEAKKP